VLFSTRLATVERASARALLVELELAGRPFPFDAGQAVWLAIGGSRKPYSIAASPDDAARRGRIELLIGTGESEAEASLRPGATAEIEGPIGSFTLAGHRDASALFLAAGGTGIAPLRAMWRERLARGATPTIDLLYSARTPQDFAFAGELRDLARAGRIRLHETVTRVAGAEWTGRRGRADRALLASLGLPASAVCAVCGPESFVASVSEGLRDLGVSRVLREEY
jgi:ferredoxin-NADP reductase